MTQDQARTALIDLGFSPFNVDLLCERTSGGDFVYFLSKQTSDEGEMDALSYSIDTDVLAQND